MEQTVLDHRQIRAVYAGLMLAMAVASLDQMIVATALPTIVGELGGLAHIGWVATAYLVTSTAAAVIYGKLSDLYDRKRVFQSALVVFLAGSVLAGVSGTLGQLIAFRALQGVGGGGLMALTLAVVADLVPPRQRGRYAGYLGGVLALATVAGPLVGGFLVDHAGWRWIFYVNLPVGLAALLVIGSLAFLPLFLQVAKGASATSSGLLLPPLMVGVLGASVVTPAGWSPAAAATSPSRSPAAR